MDRAGNDGEARLALDDPDMRLPWLESADEDVDEGLDWGRIGKFAGFVVVLAAVIALSFVGLSDWISRPPEGDGSLIEAPEEPYKVRPENPGGAQVAGTGDTAYKVGEGVDDRSVLADPSPVPTPTDRASPTPAASPEPPLTGVAVQVGAYSSEADARKGWDLIRSRYEPLGSYDRRIVQGRADIGVVYRLQAVAANTAAAFALCDDMRRNGIECQVKR
ncbi:SPOR domain-containing protein [Croceicoccus naphthovorans]|nr:SPOR domain-containing protein [Croceicoccus naphthovorans]MBB3988988.1 hypothetical protein [Croceicoccus naphthovorans]